MQMRCALTLSILLAGTMLACSTSEAPAVETTRIVTVRFNSDISFSDTNAVEDYLFDLHLLAVGWTLYGT